MIISKDNVNKNKSKYICDRCKAELTVKTKNSIYIAEHENKQKKKWDLCNRCYRALVRGINKKK